MTPPTPRSVSAEGAEDGEHRATIISRVSNAVGPVIEGFAFRRGDPKPLRVRIRYGDQDVIVLANAQRKALARDGVHPTGRCGFRLMVGRRLSVPAAISVIELAQGIRTERELSPDFVTPVRVGATANGLRRLFYIHIPKTGGTTINEALRELYGASASAVHVESAKQVSDLSGRRFLSGHVRYRLFEKRYAGASIRSAVTLRNPFRQLLSHLLWVRRLAEPAERERFETRSPGIQEAALRLAEVDFSSGSSVAALVQGLDGDALALFDNCQTRYLSTRGGSRYERTTDRDLGSAVESLEAIDCVGVTERLDEFWQDLTAMIGWRGETPPLVPRNERRYDYPVAYDDPEILEAVEPLIRHDLELYEAATKRSAR